MPRDLHGQDPVLGYTHGNDPVRGSTQTLTKDKRQAGLVLAGLAVASGDTGADEFAAILEMIGIKTLH